MRLTRRILREMTMKLVYQFEFFKKEEMEDQINVFLESQEIPVSKNRKNTAVDQPQTEELMPVDALRAAALEAAGGKTEEASEGVPAPELPLSEEAGGYADIPDEDRQEIRKKVLAVYEKLPEIDQRISDQAKRWKINRMPKTDLAILRLAVYEMLFDDDVPEGAAINEAVELAKIYGSDDSYKFVNGVLGGIARKRNASPKKPE